MDPLVIVPAAAGPPPYPSTPPSYLKLAEDIVPPTIRPVGLLACQLDPLIRELDTVVVSAQESQVQYVDPATTTKAAPGGAKGGKAGGKGGDKEKSRNKATDAPDTAIWTQLTFEELALGGRLWEVECEDTCLFPEGGGQPSDAGHLTLVGESTQFNILHCIRKGLRAIHYVWVPSTSSSTITNGNSVTLYTNWDRRLDHSSIHTSQHLLSALLDKKNLPTISWSLSPYPSKQPPYIEISRPLTKDERAEVEKVANGLIADGQSVSVEVYKQQSSSPSTDVELVTTKLATAGLERSNAEIKSLPKDYQDGYLRNITIEAVDKGPCCGTHLPSLSYLNGLHILPTTVAHNKGTVRQYFLAGPRLAEYTRNASGLLANLQVILEGVTGFEGVVEDRVQTLKDSVKDGLKREDALKLEMAEILGQQLKIQHVATGFISAVHRTSSALTNNLEFLGALAVSVVPVVPSEQDEMLLITSVESFATPTTLVLAVGSTAFVTAFTNDLKSEAIFKGRVKGGGKGGRFMGKIDGSLGKEEKETIDVLLKKLRG